MTHVSHPHERTYTVVLRPEPEGGFTVFVPALPGIVTYGATESEALSMAEDAITLRVEGLESDGLPVPDESQPLSTRQVGSSFSARVASRGPRSPLPVYPG